MRFEGETVPPRSATEYFQPELLHRREPAPARPTSGRRSVAVGIDRVMWGSDYPHEEGTLPVHA